MKKRFIPNQQKAKLAKAKQMHGALSAAGVDPTHYGLTAQEVTDLGNAVTDAQGAFDDKEDIKETKKAKVNILSGPGQKMDVLVAKMEDAANKIRVSPCTDDEAMAASVDRRKPGSTPKPAPADAPGVTLESQAPGVIKIRIYDTGSAGTRARAETAIGSQVAIVDGTTPITAGEADSAPHTFEPRSPATLNSSKMPSQVRVYARWQTQRGLVSPWSAPLTVKVA